jgi:hypothetical protein
VAYRPAAIIKHASGSLTVRSIGYLNIYMSAGPNKMASKEKNAVRIEINKHAPLYMYIIAQDKKRKHQNMCER